MPMCYCAIGCQHSTFNRLFGCVFLVWCHHLRKVNSHRCTLLDTFFCNFLIFDVPQYSNRLDYIKDIRPAIYFLTTKKSLHIIFKKLLTHSLMLRCHVRSRFCIFDKEVGSAYYFVYICSVPWCFILKKCSWVILCW